MSERCRVAGRTRSGRTAPGRSIPRKLTVWFATAACCSCMAKNPQWACDQRDDRPGKDSRRMVSLPLPHFATLTDIPPTLSANVARTYPTNAQRHCAQKLRAVYPIGPIASNRVSWSP